ncbi:MAG: hydrogenase formation protein HypD, partial [Elusimicrobiota bacterium]
MRYVDEYRDRRAAERYAKLLGRLTTKPWTVMEVCGGQTHAIVRFGIDRLLPEKLELVHGPGCPVCVTPLELIDQAVDLALRPGTVLCSFGDMLRVPGSKKSLLQAKGEGAQVRVVYSPLDALAWAQAHPETQTVFFAVGFETTAPAAALAAHQARKLGVKNFS